MFSAASKTGSQPSAAANYIEDVFSTYLYTANGTNKVINNGIDLAGKGGLVWIKDRTATWPNVLTDSVRGTGKYLISNQTTQEQNWGADALTFTSNGFNVPNNTAVPYTNYLTNNYCSWTFRKQPKFFDVVTYTGTGSATTIPHNLGSAPGMVIVKRTDSTGDWPTYHSGLTSANYYLKLNTGDAQISDSTMWNSTAPTSTVFSVGTNVNSNASGGTYVAYLFASNAGGFGLTGTDNVITCGSFVGNSSGGCDVNLGYEPQFVITWCRSTPEGANTSDIMRGWGNTQLSLLRPWNSGTESALNTNPSYFLPTSTGFKTGTNGLFTSGDTFVYLAIRRPMKVPTDATTVFKPVARAGTDSSVTVNAGFVVDLNITDPRTKTTEDTAPFIDRLRGANTNFEYIRPSSTAAAASGTASGVYELTQNGVYTYNTIYNNSSETYVNWMFSRRPGFFDEVCYTGTGSATTQAHNLGVAPELLIVKERTPNGYQWRVYAAPLGNTQALILNFTSAASTQSYWNNTTPTSSVFSIGTDASVNESGNPFVAYLFATCAGVSKVGSYTGNGTTQAISCGFTGGARFVLIKRTDASGSWYVYDTARGMTAFTSPYLQLNNTATEVATLGSVTTTTGGFTVNGLVLADINTNAASYIFLAIA
jgi:hypothetical protein